MRLWMAFLAVLPACGFQSPEANDATIDGPDASPRCFGKFVEVCFTKLADVPATAKMWTDNVDVNTDLTDASSPCDQNNDQKAMYCVVAGAGMMIADAKTLRGYGNKPLILLSTMSIDLEGTVDVSSNRNLLANKGAGADPLGACTGAATVEGDSGAAGGSFAGPGGRGEEKNTTNLPSAAPALSRFPASLRGGCPGGMGAKASLIVGGTGGSGGGAVAIIAPSININGKINASGAGGGGGPPGKSGGGGGGTGGMIVLDVPMAGIVRGSNGVLFANGGGGGEGGADSPTMGQDGSAPVGPTPAAPGGNTAGEGGNGGPGSSGPDPSGGNSPGQSGIGGGGGAGGGGPGFLHAPGVIGITVISPASRDLP